MTDAATKGTTTKKEDPKTSKDATPDEEDDQLPLVHPVKSEYYIPPLSNGISLIPEVQQFEKDLKKLSELRKANRAK